MSNRIRKWLHDHGHHHLCRVTVRKVVTGYRTGRSWLVGKNPDGSEQRIEMTAFGGDRIPVHEWRAFHT